MAFCVLSAAAVPLVAPYFGLAFPIVRKEIALALVPKLSADLACLSGYADADFIARYPATYANLALYMSLLGFITGYFVLEIASAMPRKATRVPLATSQRRIVTPNRTRQLFALLSMIAMVALFWALAFYWSICSPPSSGTSVWKAEAGMFSATTMATLGFVLIGLMVRGGIIRMRASRP